MRFSTLCALLLPVVGTLAVPTDLAARKAYCKPTNLLGLFVEARTNITALTELTTEKFGYVSNNWLSEELRKIVPWTGYHYRTGPQSVYEAFLGETTLWNNKDFTSWATFGDDKQAALFGNLTYVSKWSGKQYGPSLFTLYVNVTDCKIDFMTFQTETFGLVQPFYQQGLTQYHPHPIPYSDDPALQHYPNHTFVTVPDGGSFCPPAATSTAS